jgi:hypothetical protein
MTSRPGRPQARFTAGELDELMWQNDEVKLYGRGAKHFENVVNLPQGGFTLRGGLRKISEIRRSLVAAALDAGTLSAPNGGTPGFAIDGDATTYVITNALSAPSLVFEVTGIFNDTAAIDIEAFGANINGQAAPTFTAPVVATGIAGTLSVQVLKAGMWTAFGTPVAIRDTLRTRRFALPPGQTWAIAGIRVYVDIATAATVFRFAELRMFGMAPTAGQVRVRSFSKSIEEAYDFVITDRNIDVIGMTGYAASIPVVYAGSQVQAFKFAQKLDTMIAFNVDVAPQIIGHQGSASEWNIRTAPFRNVPNYDYGATYTNGVPAEWSIDFFNFDLGTTAIPMPTGGASFVLNVSSNDAPAIQVPPAAVTGANPAFEAVLKAAVEALPGLNPGIVVSQDPSNFKRYRITFSGAGNEGDGWAVSGRAVNKADAAVTGARTVAGVLGGEAIMSAARGWPRCGCFYQQRLIVAGFKGVANAFLASQEGDFYQIDTRLVSSSAPMLVPMDTEGAEVIEHVGKTRTLTFYSSEAEYWLQGAALARTTTPVLVEASRNGIAGTTLPVSSGNSSQYVQRSRGVLMDLKFDQSEQNYLSRPISIPSTSLIDDINDQALRKMVAKNDINRLFMVRDDGIAVVASLLQEQEIVGFARATTDGLFQAVNVNGRFEASFAVQRSIAGVDRQFLERWEEGLLFDQAVTQTFMTPQTHIDGLDDYEGAVIYVQADRRIEGPFVVVGGAIDLEQPALTVTYGRWQPPLMQTLPQRREIAPGIVQYRPARVHTARVNVVNTTSIAVGANGEDAFDVDFVKFGQAVDVPRLDRPYSGQLVIEGLTGYTDDTIVTITQTRPGLMTVTSIIVEVDL